MAVKRAAAFFAFALFAGALVSAPLELKVVGDRVNLRARPVFDAEVAGQVSSGTILVAPDGIPEGVEWIKVRPPQSIDLWIFSALVSDGIVTADDTYVRCGPGQHYKPVGKVGKGFKVEPRGRANGDWLRIGPVPTAELYINVAYVLAVEPEDSGAAAREVQGSEFKVQSSPAASEVKSPLPPSDTSSPASPASPAVALPNVATNQLIGVSTHDLSDDATLQQPDDATLQRPNDATMQRPDDATTQRPDDATMQRPDDATMQRQPAPSPPAVLSGYQLAPILRQGEIVTLRGRLKRLSLARAPKFSQYQLLDRAGIAQSSVICGIVGLKGQWYELAGSEIEVEGRLWTLWNSMPVIDASRVRRLASWEK